ncbi:hypothetical protein PCANC_18778 [Puccinia coronata f. sp. avenae]|uniref:Copper-fist domain-containing protein n=1 Tax=Puccinia coronata f. sp. avenae TaxID=200324 RepID=A0A2N5SD61_9BASI|nr:hypothetical protein PCANC_18778 [Puccinia coronata f. sp. avenae]
MVIIDGKKFACGACIKGHRSTSCSHTDRTLLEIGKKGRPPTQCHHCRELRKTSRVHSKCMCGDRPIKATRQLRVLKNGTTSLLEQNQSETIDIVNQIVNPCTCAYGGKCCCAAPAHPTVGTRAKNPKKKSGGGDTPSASHSQKADTALIESLSGPSNCCASSAPTEPAHLHSQSGPSRSFPSAAPAPFHPYTTINTLPLPPTPSSSSTLPTTLPNPLLDPATTTTQNQSSFSFSSFMTQPALFTPRTAGTALCFCGIHCPCPGCVLHDPLGLKFQSGSEAQCPTSMRNSEGCIAGLDLPTVHGLLNLSPMSESFPKLAGSATLSSSTTQPGVLPPLLTPTQMQIPGVSETFGIPATLTITSFPSAQHLLPDDPRYLHTSPPSSGVSGCCAGRHQNNSPLQTTSFGLVRSCSANGGVENPPSSSQPSQPLGGCCSGKERNPSLSDPSQKAGCCGDAGSAKDGRSRESQHEPPRAGGGCCGPPERLPSDPSLGIVTTLRTCCTPNPAPDLITQYPSTDDSFRCRSIITSSAPGYTRTHQPHTFLQLTESALLQDQAI